ncbi:MAG: uroporphyrinogen-III C-methyltransferase, partial [Planctomycetes bacterium]|nr:uroporphyrinogen-III C-methyltransferase [Planctomycetota bacterium]
MFNPNMSIRKDSPDGKVYLVGAGPGDPALITLRGVECLRQADVVLYDYLVNPQILKHSRDNAELVCLGRHGGKRTWTQDEVLREMTQRASRGQVVVRLKGGDPSIFGRLSEEASWLADNGIPFQIVPGITAALAAGSYAGIPVTHREMASAVALITGQEQAEKPGTALDFESLARFPGTLVFYMGVTTADRWTTALIRAGKPPETPSAIVRHCSLPNQRTLRCRLDEVAERLSRPHKLRPPVVVIIGQVAGISQALTWFERRALFGRTIVVTRPAEQVSKLADRLSDLGAELLVQPAIEISDPPDFDELDRSLRQLRSYDWIVFSSANGVRYFLERLLCGSGDLRRLADCRLACIGPGTAESLGRYHLRADLLPEEFRAESLAAALAEQASGKRFLLVRASRGREVLAEQIGAAGGEVDQIVAYTSRDVQEADPEILRRLREGRDGGPRGAPRMIQLRPQADGYDERYWLSLRGIGPLGEGEFLKVSLGERIVCGRSRHCGWSLKRTPAFLELTERERARL